MVTADKRAVKLEDGPKLDTDTESDTESWGTRKEKRLDMAEKG